MRQKEIKNALSVPEDINFPSIADIGMALVDYSPSASSSEDEQDATPAEPPAKRLKGKVLDARGSASGPDESELPPLPAAFHDLYASTVRRSVVDDSSLHQGRKRQMPHVVGNWPTHLYIEWHPGKSQNDLLVKLVNQIDRKLGHSLQLHNFLTSDLGTPLPLHISLSRPIALTTVQKDDYLDKVSSAIRGCHTGSFSVAPVKLAWYQSPDSNRTFLILRVASKVPGEKTRLAETNSELMALLRACNSVALDFDQPILYKESENDSADDAFHISIGWTFGLATDDPLALATLEPFGDDLFQEIQSWKIEVSGVKAKIGNVVSHISLEKNASRRHDHLRTSPPKSLFGI